MRKIRTATFAVVVGAAFIFGSCATNPGPATSAVPSQPAAPAATPQKVAKQRTVTVKVPILVKESSFYPDGLPDEYTTYAYDASKRKLLEKATFDATRPDPVERTVSEWSGDLLNADTVYEAQGAVRLRKAYGYDSSSRLVSEKVIDAKGALQSTSSYAYDGAGNKTEWRAFDAAGLLKAITRYSYDGGRLVLIDLRDPSDRSTGSIRLEYGVDGKLAKRSYFGADGALQKFEAYIYDKGLLTGVETHRPDGPLMLKVSYQYGDQGQMLAATTTDGSGVVKDIRKYEYIIRDESKVETYYE